jgi:hypothetical protein
MIDPSRWNMTNFPRDPKAFSVLRLLLSSVASKEVSGKIFPRASFTY